ncbi:MAG: T9SS type A sorting domain-containing protein [Crocinitomix sp.]|nr:T9SS type A sorting domain-containing protein [Crocinitomix sp.]
MLLRIAGLFVALFCVLNAESQINIQWESRLDGDGSFIDKAEDLYLDDAGNTFVTGSSYNGSSYDMVTVKYDSDGVEEWRSSYGGTGIDESHALAVDSNGDVFITGSRFISGTDWDIAIVKYNGVTGAELWSTIAGGTSNFDSGVDVVVDSNDDVIIVGSRTSSPTDVDFITLKYSSTGSFVWAQLIGGTGNDLPKLILIDASDNIYVGGHREFSPETTFFDFFAAKYNSVGALQWSNTEDSGHGNLDTPFAMTLDGSNDVILAGSGFTDILNEEDYMTVKFSGSTGAVVWKELYPGNAEAFDVVNAVVVDGSDNVFVTGRSKSVETSEDYYTIAYNSAGTELWSDRYSTEGLEYDEATDIRVSDDDAYVYVTGYSFNGPSNNDFVTLKYDASDGAQEWITVFDGPSSNSDQAIRMQLDASENIFITGNSHGGATNLDYSTIKYCQLETVGPPDTSVCVDGSVVLTATGGDDITWEVFTGDAGSMSCTLCASMTATPDETTVYLVSSTSLSGCVDYDTVTVEVNPIPSPTIYNDTPLEFCADGSVTLYTDTYDTYDWSTGGTEISEVVTAAGTVTLTVVDGSGCTNFTSVVVATYDLPTIEVGDDVSICLGESTELNAAGAVSYVWDEDPTLSSLLIANPIATPTGDTEYKVTGTDDNGCMNRDSLTVFIYAVPSVNAGSDETVCVGDSVNLVATGATDYLWDSEPTLSSLDIADPWASPAVLTEYFVTGTDDNGCTNRDSVIVSTLAVPDIDAGEDDAVCIGGTVGLFATGGLADMYVWNDDPTLSETDVFDPDATPTTDTEYIVEGTDINGCSNVDTVLVEVYDLPAVDAGLDDDICIGDSTQLDASGATIYTWDSDPTLSALDIPDPWANPITDKTYTLTGEDDNGCVNTDEVTVTVHALPTISAGADVSICIGDSTQFDATGGELYIWDFDPTLSNFVIGDPWAKPATTTTYIVEGTDGFGCSNMDEVTVTVLSLPVPPVLTIEGIYIVSSIELGNQWYHETGILLGETNDSLNWIDVGMNGEYWVIYTNEAGCSIESDRIGNSIFITQISIFEYQVELDVQLYPNPTTDVLNIAFDESLDQLILLTLDGKVIYNETNLNAGVNQLSLADLPSGAYLIQIIKDDQVMVRKVIKQ